MIKTFKIRKAAFLIKLFTHLSAVVILFSYNSIKDIPYLLSLVLVTLFTSYFRQFYLIERNKPEKYKMLCTAIELITIICAGFIDVTGYNLLLILPCISETVLYYDSKYSSAYLILPYILSIFFREALNNDFNNMAGLLLDVLLSRGAAIVFVTGTSYYVKAQIRESEKLARINKELEEAYRNLIDASAASEQLSIEKERIRMAREIHDTLAHTLTTLIVQLEVCKKLSSDPGRLSGELEKAQELTRSGLNDVKRTIKSLRPQALEDKPFFESVLDLINNTMKNTEVHIILNNNLPQELKLSTAIEITIFRLIQESITNSIRHGHAQEIEIALDLKGVSEHHTGAISIDIRDDGTGCTRIRKGFGLSGIQERLEAADGSVDFYSTYGNGFETKASIPLEEADV